MITATMMMTMTMMTMMTMMTTTIFLGLFEDSLGSHRAAP